MTLNAPPCVLCGSEAVMECVACLKGSNLACTTSVFCGARCLSQHFSVHRGSPAPSPASSPAPSPCGKFIQSKGTPSTPVGGRLHHAAYQSPTMATGIPPARFPPKALNGLPCRAVVRPGPPATKTTERERQLVR